MKMLLLLRHAKSSWKHQGLSDHDRPLNKRGKRDAPRVGELLQKEGLIPDLILASTAVRARDTAVAVAKSCGYRKQVTLASSLYQAGPESYLKVLQNLDDDINQVLVVGHNPDLEELVEMLTEQVEAIPTGGLAQVKLPIESWSALDNETKGQLVRIWKPKELA